MFHQDPISVDFQINDDPDAVLVFKDILALDCPCDNCPLSKKCAEELTACNQFYKFVHREDEGERQEGDTPSRSIYKGIYPECDLVKTLEKEEEENDS